MRLTPGVRSPSTFASTAKAKRQRCRSRPPTKREARDGKPLVKSQAATIDGKPPEIPPRTPAEPNIKAGAPFPMVCICIS
jgi:hypothetical protein